MSDHLFFFLEKPYKHIITANGTLRKETKAISWHSHPVYMYVGCTDNYLFFALFPIKAFSKLPDIVIVYMCLGFTGIVGILFDMICIVNGFIHDQFVAFCMRVSNFFANVKIFKKKAYEWYWDDFKENAGIMIWLFLLIFLATVFVCVFGFVKFAMWYR